MRYLEKRPPPELETYIQCFWYLNRTYHGDEDGEVLWPDGCYEIIFHFGSRYQVNATYMETSFVIGSLTHYHHLRAEGNIRLFGIRLKPWGLKSLTNINVKELKDRFAPLTSILPKPTIESLEKSLIHLDYEDGITLLKEFTTGILNQTKNEDITFLHVLSKLFQDPINQDLQAIVDMSNYSQRQFERKTAELTGLSPKKLSKVARFNQVRLKIFFNPEIDLHDCMTEFGYYDYAHFSKEFKESMGLTPNEYKSWMMEKMKAFKKPRKKNVVFLQEE